MQLLADDTKTFQEISANVSQHGSNQQELQCRIDKISQWARDWQMEINPSKSKVMHMGQDNPGLPYSIEGQPIEAVTTEKDIGFWISDELSSTVHVQKAWVKALAEIF